MFGTKLCRIGVFSEASMQASSVQLILPSQSSRPIRQLGDQRQRVTLCHGLLEMLRTGGAESGAINSTPNPSPIVHLPYDLDTQQLSQQWLSKVGHNCAILAGQLP